MVLEWGKFSINGSENAAIGVYFLIGAPGKAAVAQNGPVKGETGMFWS